MSNIKLFESQKIRSHWDAAQGKWFFSVIDVIEILTDSPRPRKYWNALKTKLQEEGSELSHNLGQLKMEAEDGKMRITDVADTEQLLRLIQSVPSPKAEPFKQWLAKIGYERIEETQDPEKTIDRAMENYLKLGYSKQWINQRLKSIEIRKELTDEWENRGVKKAAEISKEKKPATLDESKDVAKQGGTIAGNTRKEIESKTGKKIVSSQNAKALKAANDNKRLQ